MSQKEQIEEFKKLEERDDVIILKIAVPSNLDEEPSTMILGENVSSEAVSALISTLKGTLNYLKKTFPKEALYEQFCMNYKAEEVEKTIIRGEK